MSGADIIRGECPAVSGQAAFVWHGPCAIRNGTIPVADRARQLPSTRTLSFSSTSQPVAAAPPVETLTPAPALTSVFQPRRRAVAACPRAHCPRGSPRCEWTNSAIRCRRPTRDILISVRRPCDSASVSLGQTPSSMEPCAESRRDL